MKYHIHSEEIIKYAVENNVHLFDAMAILTAKDVGITDAEMPLYMEVFHKYMEMLMPVEDAIDMTVHYVVAVSAPILTPVSREELSKFSFSLN